MDNEHNLKNASVPSKEYLENEINDYKIGTQFMHSCRDFHSVVFKMQASLEINHRKRLL